MGRETVHGTVGLFNFNKEVDNMINGRHLVLATLSMFVAALSVFTGPVAAQEPYPSRPITLIVGYPPGGSADLTARALALNASKLLGQTIVVVNQAGAGTAIAATEIKNAKADGYTIGTLATAAIINQHMRKVEYDTTKDYTPVIHYAGWIAGVVVRTDAPWKTLSDFIAYAKANRRKIRYSTAGVGTQQHLTMARMGNDLGAEWLHIPYKGGPEAVAAVLRGDVEATAQTAEWTPFVKEGRMRVLATFGDKRSPAFPDVPSIAEFGVSFKAPNMLGIVAPAGVPRPIVERLHDAFRKSMEGEEFKNVADTMSMVPTYMGPTEFAAYIRSLNSSWAAPIKTVMGKEKVN